MRWLFENPQLLIVIGGAIAYWLNERRKAKEKQNMAEEAQREPTDDEMAERTRRIQEEIRRKIEERQGRAPRPSVFDEAEEGEENVEGPRTVPPPLPSSRPVLVSAEEAPGAAELERVMAATKNYEKGHLILALSYGGRTEIVDAVRAIAAKAKAGEIDPAQIDEALLARHLYLPDVPDPDLMIRTSGELRLSNFLLWELSYAEFYFVDTLWPDFREADFAQALAEYSRRRRRFGAPS